jgi:UDP-glucuronate 4-epimerase
LATSTMFGALCSQLPRVRKRQVYGNLGTECRGNGVGRGRSPVSTDGLRLRRRLAPFRRRRGARDRAPGRGLAPGHGYLVTGCAGFIGSHLTEALVARGCWVVGADAFTDNYPRSIKEGNLAQCCAHGGVRFSELDLAEDPIEPLIDEVDGVFHLAARPGVRTSWGSTFDTYLRDNLLATQRVFEAAVKRGVRVVYASSSSIYGDAEAYPLREDAKPVPVSPYGVSKLACEALATSYGRSAGLDAVGLRFFSVYGPRQRPDMAFAAVFDCLANNRPFRLLGSGRQTRDFTYVGDIVEGTLRAMRKGNSGGVYNLGGGSEISLRDALALCERVAGRRLDVQHVPAATGDARRTIADFSRAWSELGWKPTTSLVAGLTAQSEHALIEKAERALAWAQPA